MNTQTVNRNKKIKTKNQKHTILQNLSIVENGPNAILIKIKIFSSLCSNSNNFGKS